MKSQILVGIDGSAAGTAAADWAAARAHDLGFRLNLVHVVPGPWAFPQAAQYRHAMDQAKDLLDSEAERVSALFPAVEVVTTRRTGEPAQSMRMLSGDADMVVVGTDRRPDNHGEGFGSVSFQIAIVSNCAVTVVPATAAQDGAGVVVGVDGSSDSGIALERAAAEALRMGQELTAIYACGIADPSLSTDPAHEARAGGSHQGERLLLSASVSGLAERFPGLIVHETLDLRRTPADALVDASAHARLLVMGCKGRGGLRALIGSVAQHVLLNVQCPTLITRPDLLQSSPSLEQQEAVRLSNPGADRSNR